MHITEENNILFERSDIMLETLEQAHNRLKDKEGVINSLAIVQNSLRFTQCEMNNDKFTDDQKKEIEQAIQSVKHLILSIIYAKESEK